MDYLRDQNFDVTWVKTEDMGSIKKGLGIPQNLQSCHTMKIGDYFVEGHVPVEAIRKLLQEQPSIRGIALPGMPSGSPGMDGVKTKPFIIYSVAEGRVAEFMKL